MAQLRIAMIVGSLRAGSVNRRLAQALMRLAPPDLDCVEVGIGELPLYVQDQDQAPPPAVERFREEIRAAQGVVFLTPEYNRSIPGVLKNAIDHGSRPYGQSVWAGRPAGVVGASLGAIGTAAAQQHLRSILGALDMPTLGQPEVFLHYRDGLIAEDGSITDERTAAFLQGWMDRYAAWVRRFAA